MSGISIRDQFIAEGQVRALLQCAQAREARGDFAAARIGGKGSLQRRAEIRGDFICWLREPLYPAERVLFGQLEQLRAELNREAYLGLFDLELHYARYPPGAGYARHIDRPQGALQRTVSLVLYLNAGWQLLDGGALRIHEAPDLPVDIEPLGGRLVCFLTAGREHEVLPARRERLSISGWFRGRE
ncbi:MAG TPA: 2OG-Fe(II) oxygenase [Steroidobacteraceae bacterium]